MFIGYHFKKHRMVTSLHSTQVVLKLWKVTINVLLFTKYLCVSYFNKIIELFFIHSQYYTKLITLSKTFIDTLSLDLALSTSGNLT